jgi:hypothetical protein
MTVFVNWCWRYLNWTSGPRVIFSSESGVQGIRVPESTSDPAGFLCHGELHRVRPG